MTQHAYGWVPDFPDQRDHVFMVAIPSTGQLPPFVDLRQYCPPVYDQGQLGSCTANALAGALEFDQIKEGLHGIHVPSRLFIYYNERSIEGSVDTDSGAMIRDGAKSIHRQGACQETLWPYDISKFTDQPPTACYQDGLAHTAVSYSRIVNPTALDQLKAVLVAGFPFVFGFAVYESMETEEVAQTGHVPMPGPDEKVLGGHAVLCVGYNDASSVFLVRNSWGSDWGMHGYFTMPYEYVTNDQLCDDFWVIRRTT